MKWYTIGGTRKWVKYLDEKSEIHILSKGTNIKVGIKWRKWISCDGKENFPDGEIFFNMLFDEKIGGTIHMAIGDFMPEVVGKNKSGCFVI